MDEHVAITLAIDGFQDIDDKSPLDTIISIVGISASHGLATSQITILPADDPEAR